MPVTGTDLALAAIVSTAPREGVTIRLVQPRQAGTRSKPGAPTRLGMEVADEPRMATARVPG
jgi:hypothetical protein